MTHFLDLIRPPLIQSAAKFQPNDMRFLELRLATNVTFLMHKNLPTQTAAKFVTFARTNGLQCLS